jgi:hypothetical protein
MYSQIQTWFNTFVTTVNGTITGTASDLKEVDTLMDSDNLPANLGNFTYLIKLESCNVEGNESMLIEKVNVIIEFSFLLANQIANYKTAIDTYLSALKKLLLASHTYNGTNYKIDYIEALELSDLNKIEGDYLKPQIKLTLKCNET